MWRDRSPNKPPRIPQNGKVLRLDFTTPLHHDQPDPFTRKPSSHHKNMTRLNKLHDACTNSHPEHRETSNNFEPTQVKDAIKLGNDIFDLLSSCRGREGILTVTDIPHELRNGLSSDEQCQVLSWMRKRQDGKRK
jgi:hypothetical protein